MKRYIAVVLLSAASVLYAQPENPIDCPECGPEVRLTVVKAGPLAIRVATLARLLK